MTKLRPSFAKVFVKVGCITLLMLILSYFAQGMSHENWWTARKMFSFSVLIAIAPVVVWFLFVPRLLEFSETEITVSTLWRKHTYPWSNLLAYNGHRYRSYWGLYQILFDDDDMPYNVFLGAYSKKEISKLNDFIKTKFPRQAAANIFFGGPYRNE